MDTHTTEPTNIKQTALVLNACIEACIDGQKTYALAAADVRDPRLKEMLQWHSDQRARYVLQIQGVLQRMGLNPENEGTIRGEVRRQWMETRHGVELVHSDYAVLRQCIQDQEAALRRFTSASQLATSTLPVDVRVMLDEQCANIALALDETRRRLDSH
jgi:uncharacterized protein (TIGR02284 family)